MPTASQLEYLVAAIDLDSWSDAAESLGVSASAFTQGMAELEKRLGVLLFDKEGRRRVPTTDAHVAADHARRVLAELGSLNRWATLTRDGELGAIRAGTIAPTIMIAMIKTPNFLFDMIRPPSC